MDLSVVLYRVLCRALHRLGNTIGLMLAMKRGLALPGTVVKVGSDVVMAALKYMDPEERLFSIVGSPAFAGLMHGV
jgi:hypothetical protein